MELSLFRDICIIGNNKAINLILVIGTGFQVEAHTEDALGSVYACTVCNDSLTVTDDHALPTDMKRFRSLTLGGTVILGRRTLDSFPGGRPLPKRRNIVITHCPDFSREGAETVSSLAAMREATAGTPPDQLWVIGGGSIYAALLSQCARAYVTRVDAAAEGADSFFPNLDKLPGWTVRAVSEPVTENGLTYRFYDYVNTKLCD